MEEQLAQCLEVLLARYANLKRPGSASCQHGCGHALSPCFRVIDPSRWREPVAPFRRTPTRSRFFSAPLNRDVAFSAKLVGLLDDFLGESARFAVRLRHFYFVALSCR
jgi:hypothetical protein